MSLIQYHMEYYLVTKGCDWNSAKSKVYMRNTVLPIHVYQKTRVQRG